MKGKELSEHVRKLKEECEQALKELPEALKGMYLFPNDYTHPRHDVWERVRLLIREIEQCLVCFMSSKYTYTAKQNIYYIFVVLTPWINNSPKIQETLPHV